jgi:hypothetical protein
VPRSLPCWARRETIDPGHSGGTNGRLRTRSSWGDTVAVDGLGQVSERVRTGCARRGRVRGCGRALSAHVRRRTGAIPWLVPATLPATSESPLRPRQRRGCA